MSEQQPLVLHLRGQLERVEDLDGLRERRRPGRRFTPSRPFGRRPERPARAEGITEGLARPSVLARDRLYRRSLAAADALAAGAAILIAAMVLGDDRVKLATLIVLPLVVLIHNLAGLYDRDELVLRRSTLDEAPILFQLAGLFALVAYLMGDGLIEGKLDERQVLGLWGTVFACSIGARKLARHLACRRATTERCLVVGSAQVGDSVSRKILDSGVNAAVVATLPLEEGHRTLEGGDGRFHTLMADLEIDRVILAPVSTDSADMLELIQVAKAAGVRVSILPRMLEVVGSSVEFDDLDGLPMLGVRRFGLSRSARAIKRVFDLCGSVLGLLAIAPVLTVIAIAIRLDSRGPVFFRQVRVGRDGRRFHMIKFRSMVPDAEDRKADLADLNEAVGLFKIANDPRITRVGRLLRRSSLDELPQLFNVVRGEMSLVGPRPLVVDEDAQVEGIMRSRLHLTPGMTGPWQVLGSARIPMPEMVKIDYLYIAGWSLWSDIKLLMRTVPHMLSRGGM